MNDNKPTLKKPTKKGKEIDKKFDNIDEMDKMLNEKKQSLKKKIFDLAKMETLVHNDDKLSKKYQEMAEDGEEKYGYHYNETIMNIIFNDYVLNSSKYLQKYKNAVPKKKKRRDKSGIQALRKDDDIKKREKELKKDKSDNNGEKNKKSEKNENLNETSVASQAGAYSTKAGDNTNYEANDLSNERKWKDLINAEVAEIAKEMKMKDKKGKKKKRKPVDNNNYVGGSSAKPSWDGGKIVDNPNNNINESYMNNLNDAKEKAKEISKKEDVAQHVNKISNDEYEISDWYDKNKTVASYESGRELNENKINEHHLESREDKINFIEKHAEKAIPTDHPEPGLSVKDWLNGLSDEAIDKIYKNVEKQLGIDETTTASSAAGGGSSYVGYETPYAWSNKSTNTNKGEKSFWSGGEVIKENNYLINPNGFEKYYNILNENKIPISQLKKELEGTEINSLDHEGMVYVKNGTAYSADDHQPLNLDDEGWKDLYNEYFENEFGAHPENLKDKDDTYSWDKLASMGLVENKITDLKQLGRKITKDDIPNLAGQALYDVAIKIANRMLPIDWDTLPDVNSMWDYINEDGGMELNELKEAVKEAVNDRLSEEGFDLDQISEKKLNEKAKSKSQQRAAGMALAAKKGEMDVEDLQGAAKQMYDSMSKKDLEDFAETKHKGLPKHVDEDDDEAYEKEMEKENLINKIVDLEMKMYPERYDSKYDARERGDRLSMLDFDKIKTLYDKRQKEYNSSESINEVLSLHDTVEYISDREGEKPFTMNDEKWQFVNAKYPNGKTDIGVYRFGQDVVYDYNRWREEMGIDKNLNENKENLVDFDVPEWAMPALINDDRSGLSDEDEAKLDEFINDVAKQYGNAHFMLGDIDGEDNLGFKSSNDIDNLGSNVYRVYIDPSKQLNEKAESEEQRKAAGAALAAKRGEMDASELYGAAKDMYNSMSEDELEDYASGVKEVAPAVAAMGAAAASGAGKEIGGRIADKVGLNEKEKWSQDVDVERGKMHKILNIPQDKDIEDHYSSGKSLVQDLIDKVGREEAAGMINFAANINSEHNIYDDAQNWLNKTSDKENQNETTMKIKEHHLDTREDKLEFILKAGEIYFGDDVFDTEAQRKLFSDLSDDRIDKLYLNMEELLRQKGIDPLEINIGEKDNLDEHHMESREDKIKYIEKVAPLLMPKEMVGNYIEVLNDSSDEKVNDAYLKAEELLRQKGIDPEKITETMIDDQGMSMKLDPTPTNLNTSDMPTGMQSSGTMNENNKTMEESQKHLDKVNKDLSIIEMHQKKLEEDRKTSSLVMKDRYGKENEKNFKQDLKHSGTKEIIDTTKELEWKDQQTEVGDNPQKLSKDIEKQHIKNTNGDSFDNVGNSTNNDGNEIPKRNLTDDESETVDKIRKGLGDYVYDNEPDERFEERMKRDMGDEEYEKRQKRLKYGAKAPMYNKDTQPVDDGIDKLQYDKQKNKWNDRMDIKESTLTGKYVDEMGKTRFFDFSTVDVQEVKNKKNGAFFKLDTTGLGNSYNKKGQLLEENNNAINEWEFYTDGKQVFAYKPRKNLNENSEKKNKKVNEQFDKMKHLLGYNPKDFIDTKRNKL